MSATRARLKYGFQDMTERSVRVEETIARVQHIHEAVEEIARIKDKALLASYGIEQNSSSSDETDLDEHLCPSQYELSSSLRDFCKTTLTQSKYNWFELQEALEAEPGCDSGEVLERLFLDLPTLGFTKHEINLITQTKEAYTAVQNDAYGSERTARVLNGSVVTESESDNPLVFSNLQYPLCESGRILISKRQKAIRRRLRRLRAKAIADQRFLSKKPSERISKILTECDNIGEVIETFVTDHNVGADAWRHTGVLTFDGNTRLPQKV